MLLFLLSACGTDELLDPVDEKQKVIHASDLEIETGQAKLYSYLVAFKTQAKAPSAYLSVRREYHDHLIHLVQEHFETSGIVDFNLLGAVDLSPYTLKPREEPMKEVASLLALPFDSHTNYAASLVEVTFQNADVANIALKEWERMDRIWYAEPNYTNQLGGLWADYKTAYEKEVNTNTDWYWHKNINTIAGFAALDAIPSAIEDQPIIAVMDSGIDVEHPAIKSRIWVNSSPGDAGCGNNDIHGCNTTAAFKSERGNGDVWPAKVEGHGQRCPDSPENPGECDSQCCHGTHVAGIIAAENKSELAGVCPICRIMVIKIVGKAQTGLGGSSYTILDSWIIAGLKYVSSFKKGSPVRIVNASFGKYQRSRSTAVLVSELADRGGNSGTIVIGAAGNDDSHKIQYPAGYDSSIAVVNIGRSNDKSSSSNFGSWTDISAPGERINSTIPGGGYYPKTGTSMAAPVVSGVAGLVIAGNGGVSARDLRNIVVNSANPSIYSSSRNQSYLVKVPAADAAIPLLGSGIVQADAAIKGIQNPNRPAVKTAERVTKSCGSTGSPQGLVIHVLLMIPLMILGSCLGSPKGICGFADDAKNQARIRRD
jgi:hypothetical protein